MRLLLGGIEAVFSLLYLKASEMMPQTSSEYSIAFSSLKEWPNSLNIADRSPIEKAMVPVSLAKSTKGLWSVPWIQLGPLPLS